MKRTLWATGALLAAVAATAGALPASAKTDPKKDAAHVRWAHTYAGAIAEAKERNCVLFVTIHAEH
jgi:hypothetical protein